MGSGTKRKEDAIHGRPVIRTKQVNTNEGIRSDEGRDRVKEGDSKNNGWGPREPLLKQPSVPSNPKACLSEMKVFLGGKKTV